ncbi:hypothetical protein [Pseudomonas sp. DSP3-2-2]|uniref:hypothetical protein n=1 Tax=unclassified Pseudomonas TaxID=196821 RepID=UPI003CFB798D
MKKATRSVEQSSLSHGDVTTATAPNKICRVLAHMIDGHSLNRFEAERIGEHCLHTTISRLCNYHGLAFTRHAEAVPNNWGSPCRVVRYSLPVAQRSRAMLLLAMLASAAGQRREVAA